MLEDLHLSNLALIEDARITFEPGLNVITGETGAGKTVLLTALSLLSGARAETALVREGADEACVDGRFIEDNREIIAHRTVSSKGRSKAEIDGVMAPVSSLQERIGSRIDLHGQHEHQALLNVATHVRYLDSYAGDGAAQALDRYRAAYQSARQAREALKACERLLNEESVRLEADRLMLAEIEAVDPREGEDEEIAQQLPSLEHAEELQHATEGAHEALTSDGGALEVLQSCASELTRLEGFDERIHEMAESARALAIEIEELSGSLRDYVRSIDYSPDHLEALQSRLFALQSLAKRFGPSLERVIARRDELRATAEMLDDSEGALERARARCDEAEAGLRQAEAALAVVRTSAARDFARAMEQAFKGLALDTAEIKVDFSPLPFEAWTAEGGARVEFLYRPAPQTTFRPLAKIASGGEISRVMLALKGTVDPAEDASLLVFDEIDAGIGGTTALAVGKRLKDLACQRQVIVVTHLAQVAAYADAHFVIEKHIDGAQVATTVLPVTGQARVLEMARLLSGDTSQTACAHAEELLAASRQS